MAAYDYSTTAYGGGQGFAATTANRTIACRIPVNISTLCTAFGISAFTAADTVTIWDIPADFHMQGVRIEVKTACTTTAAQTMEVGDSSGAAYWQTGTDLKTVADTSSITYNTAVGGNIYTSANHLLLTFNGAAANGIFDIVVWGTDTSAPDKD